MRSAPTNVAASVQSRLLNAARETGEDFQLLLTRFALERYLRRLGESRFMDRFVLKGAMLYPLWGGAVHRPTRDLDLHGNGDSDVTSIVELVREVCAVKVEEDGLRFHPETVRGQEIREDQEYEGVRIQLECRLASARIFLQVDIGFGDVIVPDPSEVEYPALLSFPAARIRAYSRESVIAEKYQALVALGIANSRMKDFYDLAMLARTFPFNGALLCEAIQATFRRRRTPVPLEIPMGLSDEFCDDVTKNAQWRAFLGRTRLEDGSDSLRPTVLFLRGFVVPPSNALASNQVFASHWPPGGPWGE